MDSRQSVEQHKIGNSNSLGSSRSISTDGPDGFSGQIEDVIDADTGTTTTSPGSEARVATEHCGVLTINKHTYAIEYEHLIEKLGKPIRKSVQKMPQTLAKEKVNSASNTITICTANTRYKVIGVVARQMGWKTSRTPDACNIVWTDSIMGADMCRLIRRYQKVNHFPGMFEICRKDLLARNMNRMFKQFPSEYEIFPKTWHLPADYGEAIQYSRQNRNKTYILKPDQGAQGRGISLTKSLKSISPTDHMICQLYITRPLLIDGFKFDLRVYALITSIDPLRIYVFNEGLVRFATSPYQAPKGHNTTNMYMHLTNYSVNKHSRMYSQDDERGSKRKFSTFNRLLCAEGYDVVTLWNNIDDVVIKTILSAWPVMRHNYNTSFPIHDFMPACFEILGVDIIIDQNMKPWLLEVNHSPSFHVDGPVDTEVKHALIRDTFMLLNIRPTDKKRVMEEDKKRITARLLKRINEGGDAGASRGNSEKDISPETIEEQVAWEETHMGGYRRVFPVLGDAKKYCNYMEDQSQTSVYSDTFTSKWREEAAKMQRSMIAEKERFPVAAKVFNKIPVSEETPEKRKPRRRRTAFFDDGFFGLEHVSDTEERGRRALMNQRDFLVSSCGVVQYILLGFYRNRLLTETDIRRYEHLYEVPSDTNPAMPQERQLLLKSISPNKH